jgi:hypothetical protein
MPNPQRWKFGQVEIVTANFVIRASELSVIKRIERVHEFAYLLEGWLGEPQSRNSLRAIEREVTLGVLPMGRLAGRQDDNAFVANLQSAFRAEKIHVFRRQGRAPSGPLVARGRTWTFKGAEILQSDSAFKARKLADFFLIKDAALFSKAIGVWLRDSDDSRRVLEMHKIAVSASETERDEPYGPSQDKKVADELLEAWKDGRLHFLQHRIEGGYGDEDVPEESRAPLAGPPKRVPSPVKTWIEIVLIDDKGKPVPGEKYRLRITDGSMREGNLDSEGSVRVNGIDPGSCEVSFPNLDGKEWRAA